MARQVLKWAGLAAALVPLAVSIVDLYKERAIVEARSVLMEDEIAAVVDAANDRISELERRVFNLEAKRSKKAARAEKPPRQYQRAWIQQEPVGE